MTIKIYLKICGRSSKFADQNLRWPGSKPELWPTREGPCGRRLVLVPHLGRTTPASRRPHPQRTLHKDRTGGDLFLFTHLTVERCPFLFIYLFACAARARASARSTELINKCFAVQAPRSRITFKAAPYDPVLVPVGAAVRATASPVPIVVLCLGYP